MIYDLFRFVDDITVTLIKKERIENVDKSVQSTKIIFYKNNLSHETHLSKGDNKIFISQGRKSCYQPL